MIQNVKTELCDIFYKNGADKCPQILHSYSSAYYELLNHLRLQSNLILEIGVGNTKTMNHIVGERYRPGASLRSWKEFFPRAQIFGLDIDKSVLFEEERIMCFYADQSSPQSLCEAIANIESFIKEKDIKFDIILDDGSHIKEHMILSYRTLNKFLNEDGIYIIEDIKRDELDSFINMNVPNMKVFHVHKGNNNWDDFVAYKKCKE